MIDKNIVTENLRINITTLLANLEGDVSRVHELSLPFELKTDEKDIKGKAIYMHAFPATMPLHKEVMHAYHYID
jgi:hypothetical protein